MASKPDLIILEDLEFSTCGECGHFDNLNQSCWAFDGRFGANLTPDNTICQWMYDRLIAQGRYDLNDY